MWSLVSRYGPSVTSSLPLGCCRSVFAFGGRGNAAGELPHAGSNHFAVERVDLFHHRFGYSGRVEVVGAAVSNQILWHDFFCLVFVVFLLSFRAVTYRSVACSGSRSQKWRRDPFYIYA